VPGQLLVMDNETLLLRLAYHRELVLARRMVRQQEVLQTALSGVQITQPVPPAIHAALPALQSSNVEATPVALTLVQALAYVIGGTPAAPATLSQQDLSTLLVARLRERAGQEQRRSLRAAEAAARHAGRQAHMQTGAHLWQGWFDGSARPNPGQLGIGARLQAPDGVCIDVSRAAGEGDSTLAEYLALIALLEQAVIAAVAVPTLQLLVRGDSQVVINDISGTTRLRHPAFGPYRQRVVALMAALPAVALRWVPRQRNGAADLLAGTRNATD
jgi:ribonuclease HI